jgi:hypothetical protein
LFEFVVADDTAQVQVVELGEPLLDGLNRRRWLRFEELVHALRGLDLELIPGHERVQPAAAQYRRADEEPADAQDDDEHGDCDPPSKVG